MLMAIKNRDSDVGSEFVNLLSYNLKGVRPSGTAYSGVKFDNDGNLYVLRGTNNYGLLTAWLVKGSASSFYISRVIQSGSLNVDAGAGPIIMSTDRLYSIQRIFEGEQNATIDFEISSDVSGAPVLANGQIILTAEILGNRGTD